MSSALIGIDKTAIEGNNFMDFIPPPFNTDHVAYIQNFINHGKTASKEAAFKTFLLHANGFAVRVQIFAKITLYHNTPV
jgi:hypothetical protein